MSLIKATWALYRDAAVATGKALPRSGVALLFLVLGACAEMILGVVVMPMGLAGGFILGLFDAFLCAWYLALLRILVVGNRKLMMSDLRETMGDHFGEVITISFLFGIAQLVLTFVSLPLVFVYVPIVALLFNPAPEVVYQDDRLSLDSIRRSLEFMQENWPEWMAGHVLLFAAMGSVVYAVLAAPLAASESAFISAGGAFGITVAYLAGLYGPFFGFMGLGPMGISLLAAGTSGLIVSVVLFVCSHLVMVFRGQLYKKLSRSSRRGRAWQARM